MSDLTGPVVLKITREQAIILLGQRTEKAEVRSAMLDDEGLVGLTREDIPCLLDGAWGGEYDYFELWIGGE